MSTTNDLNEWFGCTACKWYQLGKGCNAFPQGIPLSFASGDTPHFTVIPGQVGDYVYTRKDKKQRQ
ncbi:MAG: hypothetical protein NVSMB70_15290 [Chamaesiphon sp.]